MNLTLDEKAQSFLKIMKNVAYPDNINAFTIRSLIEIPDLVEFFNWFLENVNEKWLLTSEQKFWFKEKESKGQVVYDLDKLVSTNKMIQDDQFVHKEDIDAENELLEYELKMLNAQFEFKQKQRSMLNEELAGLKKVQYDMEMKEKKFETVIKGKQARLKMINQSMNKSLMEFQAKLGSEEKFNMKVCSDLETIEASIERYVNNEKEFMDTVKDLMYMEFDYNNLEDSDSCRSSRFEQIEKEMKVIHRQYPKFMSNWMRASFGFKVAHSSVTEMKKIVERPKEFFEYSQEELENNEKCRDSIQTRIVRNQAGVEALKEQLVSISEQIEESMQIMSDLKVEKLLQCDMDQRQIELSLFLNKQEKLARLINSQTSRIKLLDRLAHGKLNELESLKATFEELIDNKSMLISSAKSQSNNQSMIGNSLMNNTTIQNISATPTVAGSFYNTSFSASMANLLSSTRTQSPPNIVRDQNETNEFFTPIYNTSSVFKNIKTSNSSSNIRVYSVPDNNSGFQEVWHILNKFLISVLTDLRSDESVQKLFHFDSQISVNFPDNLQCFTSLYEAVTDKFKSTVNVNVKQNYTRLFGLLEQAIDYCYEKDSSGKLNPFLKHKYDFSNIRIQTAKFLEEPLKIFESEYEELEALVIMLMKQINAERSLLDSSSLEVLKRNLFVYFLNKPQIMEDIVMNLNEIN